MTKEQLKKEFEDEFNYSPLSVIEPYWDWFVQKIIESNQAQAGVSNDFGGSKEKQALMQVANAGKRRLEEIGVLLDLKVIDFIIFNKKEFYQVE